METKKSKGLFSLKIKKSRLWIPALGVVIAIGFFNNCAIYPWIDSKVVPWDNLIITFALMVGWSGTRDILLRKYLHLGPILDNAKPAKGILTNKVWIPAIGWCLVLGYINNCILYTYAVTPKEVDWIWLMITLTVMLTASGYRDVGIYKQESKYNPNFKKPTEAQQEANTPADF